VPSLDLLGMTNFGIFLCNKQCVLFFISRRIILVPEKSHRPYWGEKSYFLEGRVGKDQNKDQALVQDQNWDGDQDKDQVQNNNKSKKS